MIWKQLSQLKTKVTSVVKNMFTPYWPMPGYTHLVHISNWICQKVPAEIVKTCKFCCRHKVQMPPSPPLCFGHTTANHPPTAHCGFTLISDQKQTIIQAYTRLGKIAKASYTVKSHLTRSHTLTAVSLKAATPPSPSPSPMLLTHNSESPTHC